MPPNGQRGGQMRARAEFNGNWAEVIATPAGLRLTTNGPADVNSACTDGGKPWTRGATGSDCTVTFRKGSAGQPGDLGRFPRASPPPRDGRRSWAARR
jgi:hypothetical protein